MVIEIKKIDSKYMVRELEKEMKNDKLHEQSIMQYKCAKGGTFLMEPRKLKGTGRQNITIICGYDISVRRLLMMECAFSVTASFPEIGMLCGT